MKTGKTFWRTLDELADDPTFVERLHNEFPSQVEAITDPTTRRTFIGVARTKRARATARGSSSSCARAEEAPLLRAFIEVIPFL